MNRKFLLLILFIVGTVQSRANIKLPKFVGDNMVLQRDIPITLWGWADQGEKITIKFLGKSYSATPDTEGKWTIKMAATKAGGPYEMVLKGKNEIKLKNILLGDVWLCGGQSNMEWTFNAMPTKYTEEIAKSTNPNIHFITFGKKVSDIPLKDVETDGWKECNPTNLKNFSAVGYFFGKDIYEKIKVPIGLISDNWGGTPAEAWMSYEGLKKFPHYQSIFTNSDLGNGKMAAWTEKANSQDLAAMSDTTWGLTDDIAQWKSVKVPGAWINELSNFDGVVWLKKEVILPKDAEGKNVYLSLANIDDKDITYFNGKRIGSTNGYDVLRRYTVPGSLVKAGKNIIAIRVSDYWGGGGITGDSLNLRLEAMASSLSALGNWKYMLPLSGEWKYKTSVAFKGLENKPMNAFSSLPHVSHTPASLFNGMLAPVIPYGIKGAIWYQGETNTGRAFEYRSLLPAMIADWRAHWGLGDFPFLIVQLANFRDSKATPSEDDWAELREAQSMTAASVPNTGLAVAIDVGQAEDIHPWNKEDVGKRLALAGLKVAYGQDIVYSGPTYESMSIEGNKIRLKFKNTGSGLMTKNGDLKEFAIAGDDRRFVWANAKIENDNTIVVWSDQVSNPLAVRYAWAVNPSKANLYNKEELPASPFRTDKWMGITER